MSRSGKRILAAVGRRGTVLAAGAVLAAVQGQSRRAQARFTAARAQLRQLAVASYEDAGESSVAALLTSGDPTAILRQASLLQQIGNTRSAQAASFLGAAQQLGAARDRVLRTEAGVAQLQSRLAGKKTRLTRLLASNQATLDSLSLQQQSEVAAAAVGGGSFITHAFAPSRQTQRGGDSPKDLR